MATGAFRPDSFESVDLIAISPGVPMTEPLVETAAQRGVPVVGDIELFAQALPTIAAAKVLAITGSNGKSTVTEMTGAMCRQAGLRTVVAGNIGLPVLDALLEIERAAAEGEREPDVFVLELSSFQLETTYSLDPHVAACLNLSEDHLDRYAGMAVYAQAKARIFRGNGVQVLNRQDVWCRGMAIAEPDGVYLRPGRALDRARVGADRVAGRNVARAGRPETDQRVAAACDRSAQRRQRAWRRLRSPAPSIFRTRPCCRR